MSCLNKAAFLFHYDLSAIFLEKEKYKKWLFRAWKFKSECGSNVDGAANPELLLMCLYNVFADG